MPPEPRVPRVGEQQLVQVRPRLGPDLLHVRVSARGMDSVCLAGRHPVEGSRVTRPAPTHPRVGLRRSLSSRRVVRRGLVSLVVIAAAMLGALAHAQVAAAAACSAGTVTTMHSPDGTARPFYGDWSHGSTKQSGYVGYELSG